MLVTGSELEVQVGSRAGSSHPWMLQGSGGEFNSSGGMARTGATCSSFSAMPAFLHEFKGHAIIARKGGEPGNEATQLFCTSSKVTQ